MLIRSGHVVPLELDVYACSFWTALDLAFFTHVLVNELFTKLALSLPGPVLPTFEVSRGYPPAQSPRQPSLAPTWRSLRTCQCASSFIFDDMLQDMVELPFNVPAMYVGKQVVLIVCVENMWKIVTS